MKSIVRSACRTVKALPPSKMVSLALLFAFNADCRACPVPLLSDIRPMRPKCTGAASEPSTLNGSSDRLVVMSGRTVVSLLSAPLADELLQALLTEH